MKRIAMLILCIVTAMTPAACDQDGSQQGRRSRDPARSPSTIAPTPASCDPTDLRLINPGVLTVAPEHLGSPWLEKTRTGYRGYEVEVARRLARRLNLRLKWTSGDSARADVTIGRILAESASAGGAILSDGYFDNPYSLLVVKGTPITHGTPLYVRDYRYGTVDEPAHEFVDQIIAPTHPSSSFDGFEEAERALRRKRIDAIVTHVVAAVQLESRSPSYEILAGFPEHGSPLRIALAGPGDVGSCLDGVVAGMKDAGVLERLRQRWLKDYIEVPKIYL